MISSLQYEEVVHGSVVPQLVCVDIKLGIGIIMNANTQNTLQISSIYSSSYINWVEVLWLITVS